jgi:hypothetical protein
MSEVGRPGVRAEELRRMCAGSGRRSEDRVVKRGFPRSHLHRAAPSFSMPGPSPSGGGAAPGATPGEWARGASLGTRASTWARRKATRV